MAAPNVKEVFSRLGLYLKGGPDIRSSGLWLVWRSWCGSGKAAHPNRRASRAPGGASRTSSGNFIYAGW